MVSKEPNFIDQKKTSGVKNLNFPNGLEKCFDQIAFSSLEDTRVSKQINLIGYFMYVGVGRKNDFFRNEINAEHMEVGKKHVF